MLFIFNNLRLFLIFRATIVIGRDDFFCRVEKYPVCLKCLQKRNFIRRIGHNTSFRFKIVKFLLILVGLISVCNEIFLFYIKVFFQRFLKLYKLHAVALNICWLVNNFIRTDNLRRLQHLFLLVLLLIILRKRKFEWFRSLCFHFKLFKNVLYCFRDLKQRNLSLSVNKLVSGHLRSRNFSMTNFLLPWLCLFAYWL